MLEVHRPEEYKVLVSVLHWLASLDFIRAQTGAAREEFH
jgi:hypothetical protein